MLKFILKRLLQAVPVLLAVSVITFLLIHAAPGGPFAEEKAVPQEVLKHLNERYKLDQPIHIQFYDYISHALQGDLGPSFKYPGRSVNEIIAAGFLSLWNWAVMPCCSPCSSVSAAVSARP